MGFILAQCGSVPHLLTEFKGNSSTIDITLTIPMLDTALVMLARIPEMGRVKTRLTVTIGPEATLRLYQAFLTDLA